MEFGFQAVSEAEVEVKDRFRRGRDLLRQVLAQCLAQAGEAMQIRPGQHENLVIERDFVSALDIIAGEHVFVIDDPGIAHVLSSPFIETLSDWDVKEAVSHTGSDRREEGDVRTRDNNGVVLHPLHSLVLFEEMHDAFHVEHHGKEPGGIQTVNPVLPLDDRRMADEFLLLDAVELIPPHRRGVGGEKCRLADACRRVHSPLRVVLEIAEHVEAAAERRRRRIRLCRSEIKDVGVVGLDHVPVKRRGGDLKASQHAVQEHGDFLGTLIGRGDRHDVPLVVKSQQSWFRQSSLYFATRSASRFTHSAFAGIASDAFKSSGVPRLMKRSTSTP